MTYASTTDLCDATKRSELALVVRNHVCAAVAGLSQMFGMSESRQLAIAKIKERYKEPRRMAVQI